MHEFFPRAFRPSALLSCALLAFVCSWARADSPASLAQQGDDYYKADKLDEAISAYRQALALDPDSTVLKYNLGTALAAKGKSDEGAAVLQEAAAQPASPARADAMFNCGVAIGQELDELKPAGQKNATASAPPPAPAAGSPPGGQEGADLQKQIETARKALEAFRKAILNDPRKATHLEAQANYEKVSDYIKELKQRQQEQQKQKQDQQKQDQNQNKDQQQKQDQQKNDQNQQQQQNKNGQGQNGQGTTPTPQPSPGSQANGAHASPTPAASATPQPNGSDQQKQDDKNKAQQEHGLEQKGQASPTPAPTPGEGETQQNKDQDKPEGDAGAVAAAQQGTPEQTPTPDQLNSQRLLNLLEKDKPEQFKKLYQFQAKPQAPLDKDW